MINDLSGRENITPETVSLSSSYLLNQNQYLREIRMILTHPFFTGQCPQCKNSMRISSRVQGGSRCRVCGWEDSLGIVNLES